MGYRQSQIVSKPLLAMLLIVAVVGAVVWGRRMMDTGDGPVEGAMVVPESVKALGPALPQPGEPTAVGMGDRPNAK
ncbi:MAG: hypothetical protein ABIV13_03935 [Fimbriimonadales bacterium]